MCCCRCVGGLGRFGSIGWLVPCWCHVRDCEQVSHDQCRIHPHERVPLAAQRRFDDAARRLSQIRSSARTGNHLDCGPHCLSTLEGSCASAFGSCHSACQICSLVFFVFIVSAIDPAACRLSACCQRAHEHCHCRDMTTVTAIDDRFVLGCAWLHRSFLWPCVVSSVRVAF